MEKVPVKPKYYEALIEEIVNRVADKIDEQFKEQMQNMFKYFATKEEIKRLLKTNAIQIARHELKLSEHQSALERAGLS